jgi:hypothetical protein
MKEYEQIVDDLVQQGYAFMPIDINLLESAESAARIFLLAQSANWQDWRFERKDNTEFGIVEEIESQSAASKHRHLALAFAHDLSRRKPTDDAHIRACLGAVTNLYNHLKREVSSLTLMLDRHCGVSDVSGRIRSTFDTGNERATSLRLRSSTCGRRSLANSLQADSVLSLHFANEDSEIWLKNEATGKWALRSPPYGSVLIFFGIKATELDNPGFKPSVYKVEASSGKRLCTTVLNVQIRALAEPEISDKVIRPAFAE